MKAEFSKFYDLEHAPPRPLAATSYRICSRCVMDSSDPNIVFDEDGVCNHCHEYDALVKTDISPPSEAKRQLSEIVARIKREGAGKDYDCVIGVSGGVDSTYVAKAVKELGLRPLAVHLDNGWNSEIAVSNISKALRTLGLDLYTHVIDWQEFQDIQRAFLLASTPDAEIPSDHAISALLYNQADAIGVRYVITGANIRTEMHLPSAWSQGHWDWGYIRAVHRQFGTGRIRTFPHYSFYRYLLRHRYSHVTIDLLNFLDYSKQEAVAVLQRELGWVDYGGKHFESVYTRWFQGCYLPHKFGFDKRRSHLSSLICSGEKTRDQALKDLQSPPYPIEMQEADCEYVAKKLDLSKAQFAQIMRAQPRTFSEFPSYYRRTQSKLFKMALRTWQFFKYRLRGKSVPTKAA